MTLQAHVVIEALVTVLALEGLLPGVHSQMGFKVAGLVEGATAELTHKLLHASVCTMVCLVTWFALRNSRATVAFQV